MKINLIKKITLSILCVFTLSNVLPNIVANAGTNQNEIIAVEANDMIEKASKINAVEDEYLTNEAICKLQSDIYNGNVKLNVNIKELDFENAKLAVVNGVENVKALTVPVVKDNYSQLSNLTVLFDNNNKVTDYAESNVTRSSNNTFEITLFQDGEEYYNEVTNIEFIENEEVSNYLSDVEEAFADYNPNEKGLNIPCFAAISGAGAGVAGIILKLCGAPCVLAPPVCIVCLGGILIAGGGGIAAGVWACWE